MKKIIATLLLTGWAANACAYDLNGALAAIKTKLECGTAKVSYTDTVTALSEISRSMFNDFNPKLNMLMFNQQNKRFAPKGLQENGLIVLRNAATTDFGVGFSTRAPDSTVERAFGIAAGTIRARVSAEPGKYPPLKLAPITSEKSLIIFTTTHGESLIFCESNSVIQSALKI